MLGALALAAGAGLATACDTNDGRTMQTPDSYQVFQLENTTATTTTTTSTIAPATTSSTTTTTTAPPTSASATTSVGGSGAVSAAATSAPAAEVGSAAGSSTVADPVPPDDTFAEALGLADLADAGVAFSGPWASGASIDVQFTCAGDDQAPLLTWTAPPEGTVEMALAITDESSDPVGFVHWVVVGLAPEAGSVGGPEPVVNGTEATNSFGNLGWQGPCPSEDGVHTYRAALYSLSQAFELPAESLPNDLLSAIEAAAAGVTSFTGTYQSA